jgi:2-oxoisovalerate dehydrogenase E1 component alpha subunit
MTDMEVSFTRYINADGQIVGNLPEFSGDRELMRSLYAFMVQTRRFDNKAIALQRTGRIPTYPPGLGQEATHVGLAAAMKTEDVLLPTYRDAASQFVRGMGLDKLLLLMGGDERGTDYDDTDGNRTNDFPQAIPIATQTAHAVGVAYAFKLREENKVAVTLIGDGGTSKGDFYEAMNFAGVWNVPVVFVVINNGWAISLPREKQTAAKTLAEKSVAAGIDGVQVDGNDIIAVYDVMSAALEKARSGNGPTVIEALTYRLTDHSTADDASKYRDPEIVSEKWKEEPIARFRTYLSTNDLWTKDDEEALINALDAEIEAAVAAFEATDLPPPEAMFDYLYEEVPADLKDQRQTVIAAFADEGENHA